MFALHWYSYLLTMYVSQKLFFSMSILILVFAILILSVLACLFWNRPDSASQTDHNRKRAARGLLIKSTSQLVLFIITALLAIVLVFLAGLGGHDVACHIVLSISLTCVNGSQVCHHKYYKTEADLE
jgi:high-affinity nickel permease